MVLLPGALAGIALALFLTAQAGGSGVMMRASTDGAGGQSDHESDQPSVSADGRYVAFASLAGNLVPGDTNGAWDAFVKDSQTGAITRVSTTSAGAGANAGSSGSPCNGNHDSSQPSISADGRYVAFMSCASDLVPGDTNDHQDIFVKDTLTGETTRVSTNSAGEQSSCDGVFCVANSYAPHISADGRSVEFMSFAQNLLTPPVHTNRTQVYIKDRLTGQTSIASTNSDGILCGGSEASFSGDGRYVAFVPDDASLVPGHVNDVWDIFVKDRQTGETTRVNTDASGAQANGSSWEVSISSDGRFVSFASMASNLVAQPRNLSGWCPDIFVKDRQTGSVTRASESASGTEGDSCSEFPSLSAHGRYVSFRSGAKNLVPGQTNWQLNDVFVKDTLTGAIARVSTDSLGAQGNGHSDTNAISADGLFVGFRSLAANLVPDDTNGVADIFKAASDAPVPECSQPLLRLSLGSVYWASYSDYLDGKLTVEYGITNTGGDTAYDIKIVGSAVTNGVVCASAMPFDAGTVLPVLATNNVTLTYSVPAGVTAFRSTVYATAENSCELGISYPGAYPGL